MLNGTSLGLQNLFFKSAFVCLLSIISIQSLIGWDWKGTSDMPDVLSYTIQSFTVFTYKPVNMEINENESNLKKIFWSTLCSMTRNKKNKKGHISMKLAVDIHGPQRVNLSVFGLWSIFFPNDEPIHFWPYVSTAGQNVNFVHEISDIWIPIRFLWYLWLLRINPWM